MSRLPKARREKIEKRTNELYQEYKILRDLREMLNLTQDEIAEKIGVKQPAVSKLESGERKLTFETFSKMITALGGEWELNVELPNIGVIKLTGSHDSKIEKKPFQS
ncbi:MAG: helix-turn-helix domain-containing protein [Waterburya sp.]